METVRARQRERLLRAVIAAVASDGYQDLTVADIVRRARVSRAAFYTHFADKQDCFLAAASEGGELMFGHVLEATQDLVPGTSAEQVLRVSMAAFLDFLASEPAFARAFYIDMSAAGSRSMIRFDAALHRFAEMNQVWHERARISNPEWPAVPYEAYVALAGAATELVRSEVRGDRIESIARLGDTLVSLHLAVLAGKPWS